MQSTALNKWIKRQDRATIVHLLTQDCRLCPLRTGCTVFKKNECVPRMIEWLGSENKEPDKLFDTEEWPSEDVEALLEGASEFEQNL